jgi:hypothetical protein
VEEEVVLNELATMKGDEAADMAEEEVVDEAIEIELKMVPWTAANKVKGHYQYDHNKQEEKVSSETEFQTMQQ